ncbi:ATP synthase F1, epsilon subunit [Acidimicrobium ferrooxidans DSM 10331]|uniref:ATP synthase epsilon chain n=1 Tax=Acidimicrobium ferrooxidans (strain DSM 10331 / JCM 15462 / NBRC 103882 / ICP) TaxID=525909 RepID=C7M160_ACIFD|nr:F0F1 ATP synthase subunit epsilon [Acidimicrobium ferrooxidans]ACU54708.1 ATP synthase F1, epsilon subunit [Acidimicrobium ferrooxidans DSM 10331]
MRATFDAVIATPEEVVFEGAVEELVMRVPTGDIAFLANHGRFVGEVEVCVAKLWLADGTQEELVIDGGLVRVGGNRAVVLARAAEFVGDIDQASLESRRRVVAELASDVDERFVAPYRAGLELRESRLSV